MYKFLRNRRHTLSGCHAIALIPLLPPTAIALPTAPPSVPAPPPYARATTSRFPRRSHTTVYPVLLAPARTYCTCWFHDTQVISSTLLLRDPGVGEYGFELLFRSQMYTYNNDVKLQRVKKRSRTSPLTAPDDKRFVCIGLKSRPRTGPVWFVFRRMRAWEALMGKDRLIKTWNIKVVLL